MTTFSNGFEFDSNSRLMITDLVATAVPATARYNKGFAFNQTDGSLYVTSSVVGTDKVSHDGLVFRNDGALFINNSAPASQYYVNGLAVDSNGVVFISSGGTINNYSNGLPMTSTDRLVTT